MKKIILFWILFFCVSPVFAKTVHTYYGIDIDEEKYNSLVDIYGENYVNFITKEEYGMIKDSDLSKVTKVVYDDEPISLIRPFATYSTSYKTINLINNNGVITIELKWKKDPKIRSYDVMAARFQGLSLRRIISFKQIYRENGSLLTSTYHNVKKLNNGFGNTFKLSNGTNLESMVTFIVDGSGKVFATYQHATSDISYSDANSYTLSNLGLGSVLLFNNGIGEKYDKMPGVNINV